MSGYCGTQEDPSARRLKRVECEGYTTAEGQGIGGAQLRDMLSPVCLKSFVKNLV